MSEEKKNEALEQGEMNESELYRVAGGVSTANDTMGVNDLVSNMRNENNGIDGILKTNTFTVL